MIQLNEQTKVCFHEAEHTYTMGDIELSGVTTMLKTMLFQDKYKDVPEEILQRAAAYGTSVHKKVENAVNTGVFTVDTEDYELANFITLCTGLEITPERSEYLVSDEESIASSIDLVASNEAGEIVLADIKTTSGGLDENYLSWQLSVYAYLFELQNPKLKVSKLYGLWLRHKEMGVAVIKRRSDADVKQLISDYIAGIPTTLSVSDELPAPIIDVAGMIRAKLELQKQYEAEVNEMKAQLLELMKTNGVKKFEIEGQLSVAYVEPTERVSLDTKKIQANHPELYEMYLKKSPVKESLKITLK
jgi:hypothetical protein